MAWFLSREKPRRTATPATAPTTIVVNSRAKSPPKSALSWETAPIVKTMTSRPMMANHAPTRSSLSAASTVTTTSELVNGLIHAPLNATAAAVDPTSNTNQMRRCIWGRRSNGRTVRHVATPTTHAEAKAKERSARSAAGSELTMPTKAAIHRPATRARSGIASVGGVFVIRWLDDDALLPSVEGAS